MAEAVGNRLRVVQWATGTVGAFALRAVIEHPDLDLVGVRVFSSAKDGLDAGDLCQLPATGIKATRNMDAIVALRPDCVLYMPDRTDIDDVCRLLESGVNIVTTRPEFFNPDLMDVSLRERVETSCLSGGASIHATGSSPGFITETLPIAFASLVRRLDFLSIEEFANCREGCSEEMLTDLMGFGETPEQFAQRHSPEHVVFEHSLSTLAVAFGLMIEGFETTIEPAFCRTPTRLHKSAIAAGTVGGMRVAITGMRGGKPIMRFRSNWFVTTDIDPEWEFFGSDGWRVVIEGDTPFDITVRLPMPIEDKLRASGRYTAHRPVNAIPYVVAAAPGIVTSNELPQVIVRLG